MFTSRRVLLCLVLGGMTTLGVAWTLAVRVAVNVPGGPWVVAEGLWPGDRHETRAWWCQVQKRLGLTVVAWEPGRVGLARTATRIGGTGFVDRPYPSRPYFFGDAGQMRELRMPPALEKRRIPRWARHPPTRPAPSTSQAAVKAYSARGWPLRSVHYEVHLGAQTRVNRGGIEIPGNLSWLGPGPVLPGRPLLLGFVGNSIFYSVAWFGLLAVPVLIRRRRRIRAGSCPGCGYDLRGVAHDRCPECGSNVRVRGPYHHHSGLS